MIDISRFIVIFIYYSFHIVLSYLIINKITFRSSRLGGLIKHYKKLTFKSKNVIRMCDSDLKCEKSLRLRRRVKCLKPNNVEHRIPINSNQSSHAP